MTAAGGWTLAVALFGVGGAFLTVWCAGCAHGYRRGYPDGKREERRRAGRQQTGMVRRAGREAWDRHRAATVRSRLAAEQDRADIAGGRGWHPEDAA